MDTTIPAQHVPLLREVLDAALSDLRFEISNTDNANFRRELKHREDSLREIRALLVTDAGSMEPAEPLP